MTLWPDIKPETAIARFVAELRARRPGYTPEWLPSEKDGDAALVQIAARYLQAIAQRLAQAPGKNQLAFLDTLGVRLIPAQAARAPMVFVVSEKAADTRIPVGTRVAAPPPPERNEQIIFETERSTGLSAAKLQQVVSLWPGRDQYIDHSAAVLTGQPCQPFKKKELKDTDHFLYLAHDTLLALAGKSSVDVFFELTAGSSESLKIIWEYWDGKIWREFLNMRPYCGEVEAASLDGTAGLKQSGKWRLEADGAETSKTTVSAREAFWIRGRLTEPLLPDPARVLPEVESLKLGAEIARPLVFAWKKPDTKPAAKSSPVGTEAVVPTYSIIKVRDETGIPLRGIEVAACNHASPYQTNFTDNNGQIYCLVSSGSISVAVGEFQSKPVKLASAAQEITFTLSTKGLSLDKAFAEVTAVDVSKPFFPFGQQPQPGSVFYFTNEEVFSKPGAKLQIFLQTTASPTDLFDLSGSGKEPLAHSVTWEYWNGRDWAVLTSYASTPNEASPLDFSGTGLIADLTVPPDLAQSEVNGQKGLWMRVRLVSGGYGYRGTILSVQGGDTFTFVVPQPPALSKFLLGYTWQYGPFYPERVLAYNDFRYEDRTEAAIWPGQTFQPFQPVSGITPALYLGFDKKLPVDRLGIFFDLAEQRGDQEGPVLIWEYWDGLAWQNFEVEDETQNLRLPGLVAFIGPDDSRPLARFDQPRYWVRARLKEDGPPGEPAINGIYANAVWAVQHQTVVNEPMGASTGQPNQSFAFRQIPVLDGEIIEVREVAGPRAQVEWRLVANEVYGGDQKMIMELETLLGQEGVRTEIEKGNLRLMRNRHKQVTEVWVRWQGQPHLFFSGPNDRHYTVDRARGRLLWGDGTQGKVPSAGAALQARQYRTGGGLAGNLPARVVSQILGPLGGIEAVFNPRPAAGGADAETLEAVSPRGPQTIRHRGRAVSVSDYETLAREANGNVAVARAIPCRDPNGQKAPGWVTLVIIPQSKEPRPWPSFGLRQEVQKYVSERASANLMDGRHVHVTGPDYLAVEVEATIVPKDPAEAGAVEATAREALRTLLHPLRGRPHGRGWEPGQDVFLAEVAAVLEKLAGVDYVKDLALLLNGVVQGNRLKIPEGKTVVAGNIRLKLTEG